MNYIAHLHIASHTNTSLIGNFLGDFVKGTEFQHFPHAWQHGIRLHRKVDSFTDKDTQLRALCRLFPANIRRVAGICLDVYFDYVLLSRWKYYSDLPSERFLECFYRQLAQVQMVLSGRFNTVANGLVKYQWLADYHQLPTCLRAFQRIEIRLHNKIVFAQQAFDFILANQQLINGCFVDFYPRLLDYATQASDALTLHSGN